LSIISLFCARFALGQDLIVNGDFESEPQDVDDLIVDWTVSGSIDTSMPGANQSSYAAALNIGGDTDGNMLSQTFDTVAGQAYTVEFDAGIAGIRDGDPLRLNVQVAGAGSLLNRTVTPPDAQTSVPADVIFRHYTFTFIADSSSATLQFTDIGLDNANADTLIDTISVVAVTLPDPTTLPLINGDFETGPDDDTGTVAGWSVLGAGKIAVTAEGSTGVGTASAAFSVSGNSQDSLLSQRFVTTQAQQYVVEFDAGVYGTTDSTEMLQARVIGNGVLLDQIVSPPYAGTFDPIQVQFHHYKYLFTADSTVSTIEFTDIGFDNPSADVVLDSVSVAPFTPPAFTDWQNVHFDMDQLNDPLISGWDADPDFDGIPNGLEFFFNTDPLAGILEAEAGSVPQVSIQQSDTSIYLTYTFRRLFGWSGTPPVVAVSDDLVMWDESGNQIEQVSVTPADDGVTEIVQVRLSTPINDGAVPQKFLRLSLTP
jgi:hypothetical protein